MHPEGHAVATGEIGSHPKVVVWDASTGVTLSALSYHKKVNISTELVGELLLCCCCIVGVLLVNYWVDIICEH